VQRFCRGSAEVVLRCRFRGSTEVQQWDGVLQSRCSSAGTDTDVEVLVLAEQVQRCRCRGAQLGQRCSVGAEEVIQQKAEGRGDCVCDCAGAEQVQRCRCGAE